MEEERTWVVKFRMSNPQAIPEVPVTGPDVYTDADVERLHERLRDRLPLDSPRRLINALVEDGALVGFLETTIEPSPDEHQEIRRHVMAAVLPYRRPRRYETLGTFPITVGPVEYLP